MTARPISAVAARAASKASIFFSSMKRKMFSSTTMASSITMPTISTSASIVTLFSVKPNAHIMPKVAMTEAGMATAAMRVERQFRMKSSTTSDARRLPRTRCMLISWSAARCSATGPGSRPADVGREQARPAPGSALTPSVTATVLAPDCRLTSRVTVGSPSRRASERSSLVPSSTWPTSRRGPARRRGPTPGPRTPRVGEPAHRPQGVLARVGDQAAGDVGVLALERVAHRGDRHAVGGEPIRLEPHVTRATDPRRSDFPDARARSSSGLTFLSAISVSSRRSGGGERDRHHGRAVVVELADQGRVEVARQVAAGPGDAVAHVLRRGVDVAVERERQDHERRPRPAIDRSSVIPRTVLTASSIGCDIGLDLLGRRARQRGAHLTVGRSTGGKRSTPS